MTSVHINVMKMHEIDKGLVDDESSATHESCTAGKHHYYPTTHPLLQSKILTK